MTTDTERNDLVKDDLLKEIQANLASLPDSKSYFLRIAVNEPAYGWKYRSDGSRIVPKQIADHAFLAALKKLPESTAYASYTDYMDTPYDSPLLQPYFKLVHSCSEAICDMLIDWCETDTARDLLTTVNNRKEAMQRAQQRLDNRILPVLKALGLPIGPDTHVTDIAQITENPNLSTVFLSNYQQQCIKTEILDSAYPELTREFLKLQHSVVGSNGIRVRSKTKPN
jgi:hypothetical protein